MADMSTTSYGTCNLCGKRMSKAGMTRHLEACAPRHDPPAMGRPARILRLRIEAAWSSWYWMDVELRHDLTLQELDGFLRLTWLECCGHLSSFYIGHDEYTVPFALGDFMDMGQRSMDVRIGKVLGKGDRFRHIYDFGSSTEVKLRVTGERQGKLGDDYLRLLSRNEPPEWECDTCGATATWICTVCMYEQDNPFYCEAHARNHDCDDPEMLLPVVNSPRMGVCAYTGALPEEYWSNA